MTHFTRATFAIALAALSFSACDSNSSKFELGENHFLWEGKKIEITKFQWRSESVLRDGSYDFDFVFNDEAENHELYFEDFTSEHADYHGDYTYIDGSSELAEFDWFGLEVNVTGNTTDTPFNSSDFASGSVSITYTDGYMVIEFRMTHSSGKVVSGYYAETV